MIEGRMNGVADPHYGQSMYGSAYPMNPAAPFFFKESHLYGRQLPKIEVTSNPTYHPYVAAEHQTPINLAKDMPPETNGYAGTYSHRHVAASPFPNIFPYHAPSLIAGPYTPHQQVHFTPHRVPYTTTTSAIPIPISRPAAESSPVEVKTSQASVNGENHAFKKPDESNNRYHPKYKSRKRQIHAPTPAPIPEPTTSLSKFVAPPVNEQSSQPPAQQSRPHQLQPPLHSTFTDDVTLFSIDRFSADHFIHCGSEEITNLTQDEFDSMIKRGEFVRMQEVTMEHWQRFARANKRDLTLVTIKRIFENQPGKVQYLLIDNSERDQREVGVLEAEAERPLFVCGRGWTSYSPDRTRERCKWMHCSKISEGDIVVTLMEKSHKRRIEDSASAASDQSSIKKQPRFQKQIDLKENRTSDYHEFTNTTAAAAKKLKKPTNEVQASDHIPLKKHWFQKNNDLSENQVVDSYHEFNNTAAAAAAAVNCRTTQKRPSENDSNNNESASAAATRKRSQEEANKTRRWSDSCLEKSL